LMNICMGVTITRNIQYLGNFTDLIMHA
jgi:hypothetical protein